MSNKHLSDNYQYAQSGFFQQGQSIPKKPYGSTCTLEYVHAMREVVESHQQREDCQPHSANQATILAQRYHIHKGLKILGDRGRVEVTKEMKQLNDLEVVKPQDVNMLTQDQRNNALPCLMFLTEKRDDSFKARMCVDGSKQEMDKSEVSAPTISTDALFIKLVVDADESEIDGDRKSVYL